MLWVAGLYHRESGRLLIYFVDDCSAKILIPPLREHIPHGSIICSDRLVFYNQPNDVDIVPININHMKEFWGRLKTITSQQSKHADHSQA